MGFGCSPFTIRFICEKAKPIQTTRNLNQESTMVLQPTVYNRFKDFNSILDVSKWQMLCDRFSLTKITHYDTDISG